MSTWQERLKKAAEVAGEVVGDAAKAVEGAAKDAGARYEQYQASQQAKITLLPEDDPCGVAARDQVQQQVRVTFPDHPDAQWTVGETVLNQRAGMRIVAVRMTPDADVGYAAVLLAYQCTVAAPVFVGTYVPGGAGWTLLSAAGDASQLPRELAP